MGLCPRGCLWLADPVLLMKAACWLSHLPLLPTSSGDVARGMGSQAALGTQGAAKPFTLPQQVHGSGQKVISGAREGALTCHPHWTLTPLTLVTQGGQHQLSLRGRKQRRPCHCPAPRAARLDSSWLQAPAAPALPGQRLPCAPLGISRAAGALAHSPGSGGTCFKAVGRVSSWRPGCHHQQGEPSQETALLLSGASALPLASLGLRPARTLLPITQEQDPGPGRWGGAWGWSAAAPSVLRGLLPLGSPGSRFLPRAPLCVLQGP